MRLSWTALVALFACALGLGCGKQASAGDAPAAEADVPSPLRHTVKSIDGQDVDLAQYRGKVVLVVNVASRCGYTKQYADLQALHEKYKDQGLAVLGFPCNQFGRQEPGTEAEIKAFCQDRFGVTFELFQKVDVNGEQASPLFQDLTSQKAPVEDRGPVKWNFEKFLIDRDGRLIGRYRSGVKPMSERMIQAVESALAKPATAQAKP